MSDIRDELLAELNQAKGELRRARSERDEARRLLGRDVQKILTEVDAMRDRLCNRIAAAEAEVESYRVQAYGKESAQAEVERLRAELDAMETERDNAIAALESGAS